MKTPNVCTAPTTHGRIVSSNPKALGASTSSRRIRREENHFIFAVGTKHHLCARNLHGRKMFTLHLQTVDLILFNLIYSLTEGSNIPIKNHCGRLQRLINHKSSWSAHERPVYRRLSEIIGFEISLNFDATRNPVSRLSEDRSSHIIAQKSHNQIFQKSARTSTSAETYNPKSLFSDRTPPSLFHSSLATSHQPLSH